MKIILAPDSFKGCIRSPEICKILKKGILSGLPKTEIISIPMADGGEGTVEAAVCATGGKIKTVMVTGPLGRKIKAEYGILGNSKTAIMEMASASGIELVKRSELNPLKATTYGTGELLKAILDAGFTDIIMGIGGSATVDGGAGMAQALGFKLLDKTGKQIARGGAPLADIAEIIPGSGDKRLKKVKIRVACDVKNPLLGKNGAAFVFGPQKGATPAMVKTLDKALANYSKALVRAGLIKDSNNPGDGAAGGLGTGLRAFCNAEIVSGAELMMDITGLKKHLKNADMIITGEGCTDSQTSSGKLCAVISETAKKAKVPVLLLSGALKGDLKNIHKIFDAAFSISTGPVSLDEAIKAASEYLLHAGKNIAGLIRALKR